MHKLFPDDIANLRLLGYVVTSKEGQAFVESSEYVIEEDFDTWFLYANKGDHYEFLDMFSNIWHAVDYVEKVLK